ncbi:MAG: TIGR00341 family protein [Actinomycetota bacterium]|nr:TIGR00341 family protein [Actinomycetota bacterium]
MIHLRLVVPEDIVTEVHDLLCESDAVSSVIHLRGAAEKPAGDVILCDVAREDASVIISDLRELGLHERGTIALEEIDTAISRAAVAAEKAAAGLPSDAVVWEEVETRTSEQTELGASFLAFMAIATMIAAVGVILDSQILIIGAMVVGPEFGPIAGFCVAVVHLRKHLAKRSILALAVGFPVAITSAFLLTLLLRATGSAPDELTKRPLTDFISHPDEFSVIVALLAGTAGVLSLTSAKSGALIGVLISVTTIPAAGNIGVAAAYGDGDEWVGAMLQLSLNLTSILVAGVVTLYVQRRLYIRRKREHLRDPAREVAGLPRR